jgi:hypothetical protein
LAKNLHLGYARLHLDIWFNLPSVRALCARFSRLEIGLLLGEPRQDWAGLERFDYWLSCRGSFAAD